jgi:hypothetical protein
MTLVSSKTLPLPAPIPFYNNPIFEFFSFLRSKLPNSFCESFNKFLSYHKKYSSLPGVLVLGVLLVAVNILLVAEGQQVFVLGVIFSTEDSFTLIFRFLAGLDLTSTEQNTYRTTFKE